LRFPWQRSDAGWIIHGGFILFLLGQHGRKGCVWRPLPT